MRAGQANESPFLSGCADVSIHYGLPNQECGYQGEKTEQHITRCGGDEHKNRYSYQLIAIK